MPPLYFTQVFASWWHWHSVEVVGTGKIRTTPFAIKADTNKVEAHLYWGLLPLGLMLLLLKPSIRQAVHAKVRITWLLLLIAAAVYATGWLMPITRHLPGFGFFNGPGRYTIVCAMAGGLLSASVLSSLLVKASRTKAFLLTAAISAITLAALLYSSRYVQDAVTLKTPPWSRRDDSWVRRILTANSPETHRLLFSGPNVGNLLGVSSVPQYLGIGPAIYYQEDFVPPTAPESADQEYPSVQQLQRLQKLGVTHILTKEEVRFPSPQLTAKGSFSDTFLNEIWGRGREPFWLYALPDQPSRIVSEPQEALQSATVTQVTANTFEFDVRLAENATVELRELMYPGWRVFVDDQFVPIESDHVMRRVSLSAGSHKVRWSFEPASFRTGTWISIVSILLLLVFAAWPLRTTTEPLPVTK